MKDLDAKNSPRPPRGEGGSQTSAKPKRRKRILHDLQRCQVVLKDGRRCEAARLRHSPCCVFHDPEVQQRREQLAEPVPYEHPEEVQRLLAEAAEAVRQDKITPKQATALGYLATLLLQNQPRVQQEKERMESLPYNTEQAAVWQEILLNHWKARAEKTDAEKDDDSADDAESPDRD